MSRQIKLSQVKAAGIPLPVVVQMRGKVAFSHITRKVDGDELVKENARRIQRGLTAADKPYYAFNISNPVIIDNGDVQPIIKQYLEERISTRVDNSTGITSRIFYSTSKSPFAPSVAYGNVANVAGQALSDNEHPLEKELANGLDVTIGLKFYPVNIGVGIGMGLDFIIVNEPVKYYEGASSLSAALAAQGITYQAPTDETNQQKTQAQMPVANDAATATQSVNPMTGNPAVPNWQNNQPIAQPNSQLPFQAQNQAAQAANNPMFQGVNQPMNPPAMNYEPN